ncbi:Hsp70 family protein [Rhodococcus sp. MSC1_016]|jgi:actin-like ATPase involved in cell morphogenesis|uniref:Hsp70 family protein n=1 Tax=Rhodococcus sp. MSC1_016 TaxID=2909266 RepID=UPI002030F84A|nr:Hsp70 family protein [Rhodococcus sp. MSC1_016]
MSRPDWLLGIDFGTSNTAAAHTGAVSGAVEALQLSHNRTTMSSAVFVESPHQIAVGDVATNRAETNPAAYLPSPKRVIGQDVVHVNGYSIPSSVPVAAVLDSVMARARAAHAGQAPARLVLTHPEAWSPREIQVLLDAAAQLGLDASQVTTVSEPRAAAHYYSRSHTLSPGAKIAVFDFGGGTLDIAVLAANEHGTFDVVAARGDNGLGGKNFDAYIRRWVDEQLEARNPELGDYLRSAPIDIRHALDDSIRRAKELLSEAPSATITVTGGGHTEKFQITREEFEELITPAVEKAVTLTRATLADAHVTDPTGLHALYLTGGSSRIPIVQDHLKALGPIATLDDPKTVVAQGAIAAAAPIVRGLGNTTVVGGAPRYTHPGPPPAAPPRTPGGPAATAPIPNPGPGPGPATTWQPTDTPAPTDTDAGAGGGRKKAMVLGAAAAALVVIAGVIGAITLTGGDENAADPPAAADTPVAGDPATAEPAGASGNGATEVPTTKEAVLTALPAALRSDLTECKSTGETENGGVEMQCTLKEGSALTAGISDQDFQSIIVSVDAAEAKKRVLGIRQGFHNDTTSTDNEIVENIPRTAAAHIDGPGYAGTYSIWYANGSTGVMASFGDAQGMAGAKTFLSRAGLIN